MKARDFNFYDEMGVDLSNLGCVMLDVETPFRDYKNHPPELVPDFHVTLRYGFLPMVKRRHVEAVLDKFILPENLLLSYKAVNVFDVTNNKKCVVVKVFSGILYEINDALSVLPNVRTFPYNPHVTIGYFDFVDDNMIKLYEDNLDVGVKVLGVNYGKRLNDD